MGKIIKDGVEHFFFGGGSGSGDNIEIMTRAEYDALVEAGTVDNDVYYFITDAGSGSTGNASDVVYDNTESGLTATDVQGAVDELNQNMGNCTFSVQGDGAYVTYTPAGGADPVTKKLGEPEGQFGLAVFTDTSGMQVWHGTSTAVLPKGIYEWHAFIQGGGTEYYSTWRIKVNDEVIDSYQENISGAKFKNGTFELLEDSTVELYTSVFLGRGLVECHKIA